MSVSAVTSLFPGGICHIRTTPGDDGWFSPPEAVPDYSAWLLERHDAAQWRDGDQVLFYGFAQAVHQILFALKHHGLRVRYEGEHADEAQRFIEIVRRN